MEESKRESTPATKRRKRFAATGRRITLALCLLGLGGCLLYTWMTRDALVQLAFLRQQNQKRGASGTRKSIVSIAPWQTAVTLEPMALSAEEQEFAHSAERLADHTCDQAFAAALRMTVQRSRHLTLSPEAQQAARHVADLEQLVKQDRQQVRQFGGSDDDAAKTDATTAQKPDAASTQKSEPAKSAKEPPSSNSDDNDDLEMARAQLNLDSGELDDARRTLAQLSGDNSGQIQQELNTYHLEQQRAETGAVAKAARAVSAATKYRTLLMRYQSWQRQNERMQLLRQAAAEASKEQTSLIAERAATQATLQKASAAEASTSRLEQLRDKNSEHQILAIYDDRIETDRQLAGVYNRWIAQVETQHRITLHMFVSSLIWIFVVIICTVLADMLAMRLLAHPSFDQRQARTLRSLVRLSLQIAGATIILLIVFGVPHQISTVLGLTTAGLTIALQDFVLAFFGWFLLVGHNGIHAGDWVEINGVNGEVVEVGLFHTTMIEMGSLSSKGHPTGRRISFINSFAIRGQYFNFSSSGQWMWDEVSIGIPRTLDVHQVAAEIEQLVREKTDASAREAEQDWSRAARGSSLARLAANSTISMRPTVEGIEVTVHYITSATHRFALRDQLYLQLLALLQAHQAEKIPQTEKT
jgi:small-conductance mechanosensitive channel